MGFSYLDVYNNQKAKEEISNKRAMAEQANLNSQYRKAEALRESAKAAVVNKAKAYSNFKKSVTESYVAGLLWSIYESVLDANNASDFAKGIARSTLSNYVKENGAENILKSMNGKTRFLSEAAKMIDDFVTEAIYEADKDNEDTFAIDPAKEQEFYDNLSNSDDVNDITNAIRMRVIDAEEKMATDNIQDKMDMDDIMHGASQRIESIKQSNSEGETSDDSAELQQQEAVMMSKARMNDLATKRSRSVLEQMVRNSSKEVLKDERLAKVYSENGKIDFDKLIEANTSIYTFMEMLNTMQLEDFTEESVKRLVG